MKNVLNVLYVVEVGTIIVIFAIMTLIWVICRIIVMLIKASASPCPSLTKNSNSPGRHPAVPILLYQSLNAIDKLINLRSEFRNILF